MEAGPTPTAAPLPESAERFGVDRRTNPMTIEEAHVARTYSHLHFGGTTEAAFNFYKAVFGTEFVAPIVRMGDLPAQPGMPALSDDEKHLILNVQLSITGGHQLVGNDAPAWMGTVNHGNALDIGLAMDTRTEADRIYAALAEGGTRDHELGEIYSGDYYGSVIDKFGTTWVVSCTVKP
jgi:PhnB protein